MKHTILYKLLRSTLCFALLIPAFARSDVPPGPPTVSINNTPTAVPEWRVVGVLEAATDGRFITDGEFDTLIFGYAAADKMCEDRYGRGARWTTDVEWSKDTHVEVPTEPVDSIGVWVKPTELVIVESDSPSHSHGYHGIPTHGLYVTLPKETPVPVVLNTACSFHSTNTGPTTGLYGNRHHRLGMVTCSNQLYIACSTMQLLPIMME